MDPFASLINPTPMRKVGRLAVRHSTHIEIRPRKRRAPTPQTARAEARAAKKLLERKTAAITRLDRLAKHMPEAETLVDRWKEDLKAL